MLHGFICRDLNLGDKVQLRGAEHFESAPPAKVLDGTRRFGIGH